MKKFLAIAVAFFLFSSVNVSAVAQTTDAGLVEFIRTLEAMNSMEAEFVQRTRDKNNRVLQELKGSLIVAKPGKLRWVTLPPYAQEVVSDGNTVFVFDEDLDQVTIRNMEQRIQETPALLLSGNGAEIKANFSITLTITDNIKRFQLTPKDASQLFERIDFQYAGEVLESMSIYDATGQVTEIVFDQLKLNKTFSAFTFVFEIPEGADIIDARK